MKSGILQICSCVGGVMTPPYRERYKIVSRVQVLAVQRKKSYVKNKKELV